MARQLMGRFGRIISFLCRAGYGCVLSVLCLSKLRKPEMLSSDQSASGFLGSVQLVCSKVRHWVSPVFRTCVQYKIQLLDENGNLCENCSEIIMDIEHKIRNIVCNVWNNILTLVAPDKFYRRYQRV